MLMEINLVAYAVIFFIFALVFYALYRLKLGSLHIRKIVKNMGESNLILQDKCNHLNKQLSMVIAELANTKKKLKQVTLSSSHASVEQAKRMIELGASPSDLEKHCGLNPEETDLIRALD